MTVIANPSGGSVNVSFFSPQNAFSLVTSAWAEYGVSESMNFIGTPSLFEEVGLESAEIRMVRSLSIYTNAEQLNTLNGSVMQSFVFGTKAPHSAWSDYIYKSQTVRVGNLIKGFDAFWVAGAGEYGWKDSWPANPFTDEQCAPNVCIMNANYTSLTVQFQQKHHIWYEFCTSSTLIPTHSLVDQTQAWIALVSAFIQSFRFSENFDHKKVIAAALEAGKWLAGGSSTAVALRKAIMLVGKGAATAALTLI
jgi:hypothetical protein